MAVALQGSSSLPRHTGHASQLILAGDEVANAMSCKGLCPYGARITITMTITRPRAACMQRMMRAEALLPALLGARGHAYRRNTMGGGLWAVVGKYGRCHT